MIEEIVGLTVITGFTVVTTLFAGCFIAARAAEFESTSAFTSSISFAIIKEFGSTVGEGAGAGVTVVVSIFAEVVNYLMFFALKDLIFTDFLVCPPVTAACAGVVKEPIKKIATNIFARDFISLLSMSMREYFCLAHR